MHAHCLVQHIDIEVVELKLKYRYKQTLTIIS